MPITHVASVALAIYQDLKTCLEQPLQDCNEFPVEPQEVPVRIRDPLEENIGNMASANRRCEADVPLIC